MQGVTENGQTVGKADVEMLLLYQLNQRAPLTVNCPWLNVILKDSASFKPSAVKMDGGRNQA